MSSKPGRATMRRQRQAVDYREALEHLRSLVSSSPPEDAAARVVEALHAWFPHYSWVGIYWVEGSDLVLGPWAGPAATEHTRIPLGVGLCGAAAASGRPEVVADVTADPRYLACFPSTRAEIVVPIVRDGQVVGEIDIDGDEVGAFGAEDLSFLESVARLLAPLAQGGSRGHAD
jgi:GAF domain-containing protein